MIGKRPLEVRNVVPCQTGLFVHISVAHSRQGFLVYFESELLRRAHKNFDFRNGRYSYSTILSLFLVWKFTISHSQHWKLLYCGGTKLFQIPSLGDFSILFDNEQPGNVVLLVRPQITQFFFSIGNYPSGDCDEPYSYYCRRAGK